MFKALLVITIGFLPSMFSWWVMRKNRLRTRSRLRQAARNFSWMRVQQHTPVLENVESNGVPAGVGDRYYLEGVGYLIGDISCQFNARSGYLRCAVNPCGPCQGCRYYEPKEFISKQS